MSNEKFVYDIRRCLRINHTHHDGEIADLIASARADLISGGILSVKANNESDALIKRAITLYVKANFGLDNPDSDKYQNSYEMLKRHLQLSDEYIKGA